MKDPIDHIVWRHVDDLDANNYNPNVVLSPELRLLETSLLQTGWIQPVLILDDGTIIDGFHRVQLARESKALRSRYRGRVPCAILDVSRAEAMMLTVRINRAKGSHEALQMSRIVKELIDVHTVSEQEVSSGIGASLDEVRLLYADGVFKARKLEGYRYSRAWVPAEERK